jgi:hypothetical protein
MSGRVVVVDANVLYSIELTDLLLTFAAHRLVRVHWSPTILDEVRRNLAKRADLSLDVIAYRIDRMNRAVQGALEQPPEALVAAMPVTEHDRHVLALGGTSRPTRSSRSTCATSQRAHASRMASRPSIRTASRWPLPRATHRGPRSPWPTSLAGANGRR